jgi:hypothetical protein
VASVRPRGTTCGIVRLLEQEIGLKVSPSNDPGSHFTELSSGSGIPAGNSRNNRDDISVPKLRSLVTVLLIVAACCLAALMKTLSDRVLWALPLSIVCIAVIFWLGTSTSRQTHRPLKSKPPTGGVVRDTHHGVRHGRGTLRHRRSRSRD